MKKKPWPKNNDDAWEALRHLPTPPTPQGMEERFWLRFETELGPEERKRQAPPQPSWWQLSLRSLYTWKLPTAAAAAFLFGLLAWNTRSLLHHQPNKLANKNNTTHQPTPTILSSKTNELELYQNMGLLKNMELFENLDAIEQMSKRKGS